MALVTTAMAGPLLHLLGRRGGGPQSLGDFDDPRGPRETEATGAPGATGTPETPETPPDPPAERTGSPTR